MQTRQCKEISSSAVHNPANSPVTAQGLARIRAVLAMMTMVHITTLDPLEMVTVRIRFLVTAQSPDTATMTALLPERDMDRILSSIADPITTMAPIPVMTAVCRADTVPRRV